MASILFFGERMARAKAQKRARFAALSRSGNSAVRQFAPEHSPEPDSDSSAVSLSDYFSSSEESGDSNDDKDEPRPSGQIWLVQLNHAARNSCALLPTSCRVVRLLWIW